MHERRAVSYCCAWHKTLLFHLAITTAFWKNGNTKFPFNKDMAQKEKGLTRNVPFQCDEKDWNTLLEHLAGKSDSPFVTILSN